MLDGGIPPLPCCCPIVIVVLLPLPPVPCPVGTLAPVPCLQDRVRSRVSCADVPQPPHRPSLWGKGEARMGRTATAANAKMILTLLRYVAAMGNNGGPRCARIPSPMSTAATTVMAVAVGRCACCCCCWRRWQRRGDDAMVMMATTSE
jgi:hypothetical protein